MSLSNSETAATAAEEESASAPSATASSSSSSFWWTDIALQASGRGTESTKTMTSIQDFSRQSYRRYFSRQMSCQQYYESCSVVWLVQQLEEGAVSAQDLWKASKDALLSSTDGLVNFFLPSNILENGQAFHHRNGQEDQEDEEERCVLDLLRLFRTFYQACENQDSSNQERPAKRQRNSYRYAYHSSFTSANNKNSLDNLMKGSYKIPTVIWLLLTQLSLHSSSLQSWQDLDKYGHRYFHQIFRTLTSDDIQAALTVVGLHCLRRNTHHNTQWMQHLTPTLILERYLMRSGESTLSTLKQALPQIPNYYALRAVVCEVLLDSIIVGNQDEKEEDSSFFSEEEARATIQACCEFLNREHPRLYLQDIKQPTPETLSEPAQSPQYPLLVHLGAWLLQDNLSRAVELARLMERHAYLEGPWKDEAYLYIWQHLSRVGLLFLDGNDTHSDSYIRKREFLYNDLVTGMGTYGKGSMMDFYPLVARKVWEHPEATAEEKRYVLVACQQTLLRLLLKCQGLGSNTIVKFLQGTEWPVSCQEIVPHSTSGKVETWAAEFLMATNPIPPSLLDEDGILNLSKYLEDAEDEEQKESMSLPESLVVEPPETPILQHVALLDEEIALAMNLGVPSLQPKGDNNEEVAVAEDKIEEEAAEQERKDKASDEQDLHMSRSAPAKADDQGIEEEKEEEYSQYEDAPFEEENAEDQDDIEAQEAEVIEIGDDDDDEEDAVDDDNEADEDMQVDDDDDNNDGEEEDSDNTAERAEEDGTPPRKPFIPPGYKERQAYSSSDEDARQAHEEQEDASSDEEHSVDQHSSRSSENNDESSSEDEDNQGGGDDDVVVIQDSESEQEEAPQQGPVAQIGQERDRDEETSDSGRYHDADSESDVQGEEIDHGGPHRIAQGVVHDSDSDESAGNHEQIPPAENAHRVEVQESSEEEQDPEGVPQNVPFDAPVEIAGNIGEEDEDEDTSKPSEIPPDPEHSESQFLNQATSGNVGRGNPNAAADAIASIFELARAEPSADFGGQPTVEKTAQSSSPAVPTVAAMGTAEPEKTKRITNDHESTKTTADSDVDEHPGSDHADTGRTPQRDDEDRKSTEEQASQEANVDSDATDDEDERAIEVEKAETEDAAVGGEFGDTTEEENDHVTSSRANMLAAADRRADLRSRNGYASQLEDGYEPEDTHGYTEEEVSEEIHTEDEDEERRSAVETNKKDEAEPQRVKPIEPVQHHVPHSSDDMDAADEHTEHEEDLGAESSEMEENAEPRNYPYSPSSEQDRDPTTLLEFAQSAQRLHQYGGIQTTGKNATAPATGDQDNKEDTGTRQPCDKSVEFAENTTAFAAAGDAEDADQEEDAQTSDNFASVEDEKEVESTMATESLELTEDSRDPADSDEPGVTKGEHSDVHEADTDIDEAAKLHVMQSPNTGAETGKDAAIEADAAEMVIDKDNNAASEMNPVNSMETDSPGNPLPNDMEVDEIGDKVQDEAMVEADAVEDEMSVEAAVEHMESEGVAEKKDDVPTEDAPVALEDHPMLENVREEDEPMGAPSQTVFDVPMESRQAQTENKSDDGEVDSDDEHDTQRNALGVEANQHLVEASSTPDVEEKVASTALVHETLNSPQHDTAKEVDSDVAADSEAPTPVVGPTDPRNSKDVQDDSEDDEDEPKTSIATRLKRRHEQGNDEASVASKIRSHDTGQKSAKGRAGVLDAEESVAGSSRRSTRRSIRASRAKTANADEESVGKGTRARTLESNGGNDQGSVASSARATRASHTKKRTVETPIATTGRITRARMKKMDTDDESSVVSDLVDSPTKSIDDESVASSTRARRTRRTNVVAETPTSTPGTRGRSRSRNAEKEQNPQPSTPRRGRARKAKTGEKGSDADEESVASSTCAQDHSKKDDEESVASTSSVRRSTRKRRTPATLAEEEEEAPKRPTRATMPTRKGRPPKPPTRSSARRK